MPYVWLSVLKQHQDGQQHRDGDAFDGITRKLAVQGDDGAHYPVQFLVLALEPDVSRERVESLESEEGNEDGCLPARRSDGQGSGKHGKYWCSSSNRI